MNEQKQIGDTNVDSFDRRVEMVKKKWKGDSSEMIEKKMFCKSIERLHSIEITFNFVRRFIHLFNSFSFFSEFIECYWIFYVPMEIGCSRTHLFGYLENYIFYPENRLAWKKKWFPRNLDYFDISWIKSSRKAACVAYSRACCW